MSQKRLADAEKAHIAVMHRPAKGMSAEHTWRQGR
jgi:hypothetical protein